MKSESEVTQSCPTPWTAAYQAPPSMGFFRQEYWSGVPLPSLVFNIEPNKYVSTSSHLNYLYIFSVINMNTVILLDLSLQDLIASKYFMLNALLMYILCHM